MVLHLLLFSPGFSYKPSRLLSKSSKGHSRRQNPLGKVRSFRPQSVPTLLRQRVHLGEGSDYFPDFSFLLVLARGSSVPVLGRLLSLGDRAPLVGGLFAGQADLAGAPP